MLSNAGDILKFGVALLDSYHSDASNDNNADAKKVCDEPVVSALKIMQEAMNPEGCDDAAKSEKTDKTDKGDAKETNTQWSQQQQQKGQKAFLKSGTVREMWTPAKGTRMTWDRNALDGGYGMGWGVVPHRKRPSASDQRFYVSHTGGAVGASSVLLIMPAAKQQDPNRLRTPNIVIAIVCNLQGVNLNRVALKIANFLAEDADFGQVNRNLIQL